ncbi:MAG: hypothetical protein WC856_20820 [Methylococcaceae bacterium]|jgi:hypothetical protein
MKQNKLTVWRGEKSKSPYGILNSETAAGTSINVIYRNMLSVMNITRSFEKMFHAQCTFTTIKSYGVLLLPVFLLSGCLAAPIKPSANKMSEILTVLVVPVESPPLEVIPDLIEARFPVYRQYHYQAMPYYAFLEKEIYKNPGGVLIAGLVSEDDSVPVADIQRTSASMEKSTILESAASLPEYWTPTFMLAQEAVSQLNREGLKAVLSKHYYRLPIASGDRNANLGNWHDAIGQWYNQSMSSVDYRQPGLEHVDAVLEVGIGTYRIFDVQTSLQVLIKLIDPNTGQVIGRNSAKTFSVEDSPQTLLSQEAEKFKQLMTGMGAQLVARGFSGLGLPLNVSVQPFQPAPVDN